MSQKRGKIQYKNAQQVANIRESGKYLTVLLGLLKSLCKPGVSTLELEVFAERYLMTNNLVGAFKGYGGFPTNLCTSVNDCVVHGVPDATPLSVGDVLKVDCGVTYKGGISDAAFTVVIGGDETNPEGAKLISVTKKALDVHIKMIKPGMTGKTRARSMQQYVQSRGCSIIKTLTGHGVGNEVHEAPSIYNRPQNSTKKRSFQPGMVIAIEPITALGSEGYVERKGISHNLYTELGDIGAQREYTAVVTDKGCEVLAGLQ